MKMLPPYVIDGKTFKSVAGLCAYLARKHAASEVGCISGGVLKVFGVRTRIPQELLATYRVAYKPDAIELTEAA